MTTLQGIVQHLTPQIAAFVLKTGIVRLGPAPASSSGTPVRIVVDTGFTGGISLPMLILQRLKLKFFAYVPYILADHRRVEIPTFDGYVIIGRKRFATRYLPGQPLLGMEFMEAVFARLHVDFRGQRLRLG